MRHHVDNRKLGMKSAHRKAMLANMAASLILSDRIETTLPKAKELRRIADRMVTLSKRQTIHARRQALSVIRNRDAVNKAFDELAKRFADRHGGYTRIYKLGFRHGDSAPMAIIEYISKERTSEKVEKPSAKKPKVKVKAKERAEAAPETEHEERHAKSKKGASKKSSKAKSTKKKDTKKSESKPKKSKKS